MAARQPSGTASPATSRHQPLVRLAGSAAFCDAPHAMGSTSPYRSRRRHGTSVAPISGRTVPGQEGGTAARSPRSRIRRCTGRPTPSMRPLCRFPRPSRPHRAGLTHPSVAESSAENRFVLRCAGQCSHRPVDAIPPRLDPPAVSSISVTQSLASGSADNRTVPLPRICSLPLPAPSEDGADGPPTPRPPLPSPPPAEPAHSHIQRTPSTDRPGCRRTTRAARSAQSRGSIRSPVVCQLRVATVPTGTPCRFRPTLSSTVTNGCGAPPLQPHRLPHHSLGRTATSAERPPSRVNIA